MSFKEELDQLRYDLLQICDRLKKFSEKVFFGEGEKGPSVKVHDLSWADKGLVSSGMYSGIPKAKSHITPAQSGGEIGFVKRNSWGGRDGHRSSSVKPTDDSKPPESEPERESTINGDTFEYNGKTYTMSKFKPCKYKCGMFTAWGQPYEKGDKILHINPLTKEIIGYQCPRFEEQ